MPNLSTRGHLMDTKTTDTLLTNFLSDTYLTERFIEKSTRDLYRIKVRRFSEFLGREARIADLNSTTVNAFLTARLATQSKVTVHGERAILVAIWNHAAEAGELPHNAERVKIIKKDDAVVEGWDAADRVKLLRAVERIEGEFRGKDGIAKRDYWRAVVLTLYDTGLRIGDLFNLDAAQVKRGAIVVIQRKTKKAVEVPIGADAWAAVQAIHPKRRKKPFALICRHYFFDKFAEICDAAGLDGRTRKLRIASGSEYERLYPGEGHHHLGNTRQVFDKHYNCRRITRRDVKAPPPFGELQ